MSKEHHPILNTNTLDFLKQNVLTVTDLTRSNKLSEILDRFSTGVSEEVFVIQNGKKKNAQAVMLDMDYFEQLLQFKEIIEASLDQVAMEEAYGRIGKPVNQSLSDVFDEEDINVTELIKLLEED
ncbi:hypothetical protein [Halolactibacillus halophilus]|nr:hypothetical protein [Halolactibacillus halophilus]